MRHSFAAGLLLVAGSAFLSALFFALALSSICRSLPETSPHLPPWLVNHFIKPACTVTNPIEALATKGAWSLMQTGWSDVTSGVSEITSEWSKTASAAAVLLQGRISSLDVSAVSAKLGDLFKAGSTFPPRLPEHAVVALRQWRDALTASLRQLATQIQVKFQIYIDVLRARLEAAGLLPSPPAISAPPAVVTSSWELIGAVLESAAGQGAFQLREDAWRATVAQVRGACVCRLGGAPSFKHGASRQYGNCVLCIDGVIFVSHNDSHPAPFITPFRLPRSAKASDF